MALHCTECGFVNGEGANYCQRCGSLLAREEAAGAQEGAGAGGDPITATYRIDETGELVPLELGGPHRARTGADHPRGRRARR